MTKLHRLYAEECAETMANDFIEHPEWRGPSFTFEKLPDMIMRFTRTQSRLSFVNIKEHEANEIGELAREITNKMLKERGLNN